MLKKSIMKRALYLTVLISITLSNRAVAQDVPVFAKGEISKMTTTQELFG
jgi:hypothetical protein